MKTERTALFLMANLGSEISRLLSALERGDTEMAKSCQERSEKIVAQVQQFPEMKKREAETSILRDIIKSLAQKDSQLKINSENLRDYFTPFALRVMR